MQSGWYWARPLVSFTLWVCVLAEGGEWSEWGGWTCSQDGSNSASRSRTRLQCTPEGSSNNCTTLIDTETNTEPVEVTWSEWSEWSPQCDSSEFLQSRQRSCFFPSSNVPVCSSQCGAQNRTVSATRLSPATPCCEDLPWDEWSEWVPGCPLNCTPSLSLDTTTDCVLWAQYNYVSVQTRSRNRTICTAQSCPSCDPDIEMRNISLQSWSSWGSWTSHDPCSSEPMWQRTRSCVLLSEGADDYCKLCKLGQVEVDTDATEMEMTASQNCTESPSHNPLSSVILIVIPVLLLVAVASVLGGTLFVFLCWKELKKNQAYTFSREVTMAQQDLSTLSYRRQLLFNESEEGNDLNNDEGALPLVPMKESQEGIPRHASVVRTAPLNSSTNYNKSRHENYNYNV